MMKKIEPFLYSIVFVVLSAALIGEGARAAALERKVPVSPQQLYKTLTKGSSKLQIIDVREDPYDFEDAHIPGAIPFPNCELDETPDAAKQMIEHTVPTVIVSEDGDDELYERCATHFTSVRNLKGGFDGWFDANYPEDVGEYELPPVKAGGGCL